MENEQVEKKVAQTSAFIYLPISAGAALLFLLAASLTGNYPIVARIGGASGLLYLALLCRCH